MSVFQSQLARHQLLSSVAIISVAIATPAMAQSKSFNIPSMPVKDAAAQVARTAQVQVLVTDRAAKGRKSNRLVGEYTVEQAFQEMLKDTGLTYTQSGPQTFVIKSEAARPSVAAPMMFAPTVAAAVQSAPQYDEIIVTAQKKEERITDVPIAMSAFSAEALDDYKIEGGSELLRAIPNVNFSKSNFSMYNFSIRGVGTKAISASSDPAVAINFNNTPLVRNRLFESEFFDMQRIEVLRGPQGTLYGRNATAGVVNMITNLPEEDFDGSIKAEIGNYKSQRLNGMLNVPISSNLSFRIAGALTKRDGYDFNTFNNSRVNGRDLWSTRASLRWVPSENLDISFIWQRFEEDDNRSRTGKQICHTDPGPEFVGNVALVSPTTRGKLSQGCKPGSVYSKEAFGVPNGNSLVYVLVPAGISLGFQPGTNPAIPFLTGPSVTLLKSTNPYQNVTQSSNLREISTSIDPKFSARNDIFQLNLKYQINNSIDIISQTSYANDNYFSMQDYNRYVGNPIFNSSNQTLVNNVNIPINTVVFPGPTPNGMFCDWQLGCSDRMLSADISSSSSTQWYQELRVLSSFGNGVDFSVGANYLNFKSQDNYYVFNNLFTLIAEQFYSGNRTNNTVRPCDLGSEVRECPYVEKNSISRLNNTGHNYFLSQNGIKTESYAAFGEVYFNPTENFKITAGARLTRDNKISTQVPSQLLLGGGSDTLFPGDITGGRVNSGYPALPDITQSWKEWTGRLVFDWKPDIKFTDISLIYLSFARGYKGGGTNPPRVDFNPDVVQYQFLPETFKPEFVNSIELGMKNTIGGGRLNWNANIFYYKYQGYQVSQIVDRIAYNENFNASIYGLEMDAAWQVSSALRLDASLGVLKSRLHRGSESIDVMDRTQGDDAWMVVRPWLQVPSNCIAPSALVEKILIGDAGRRDIALAALCPGSTRLGDFNPSTTGGQNFNNIYGFTYDIFAPYNASMVGLNMDQGGSGAPNGGRGFFANLSGNELPNAPRWTFNVGAQYKFANISNDWDFVIRSDYYRQSKSFARVYNTEFDTIRGWGNLNISLSLQNVNKELDFQVYVKNVFNSTPITDFFVNSDDTGLTANVFTLDPRIIGFSLTKRI